MFAVYKFQTHRVQPEQKFMAGIQNGTGIPFLEKWNRNGISQFRFWLIRTGIEISKFRFMPEYKPDSGEYLFNFNFHVLNPY